MKDDLDFVLCDREDNVAMDDLRERLQALGTPEVVFPAEIFHAGELRQPAALHAVMRRLGYIAVMPKEGTRWRWHGNRSEFSARWAYVLDSLMGLNFMRLEVVGAKINARAATRLSLSGSVGGKRSSVGFGEGRSGRGEG